MNYEMELKRLKDDLDKATNLKNRYEGRLQTLKQQEEELLNELNKMGIKPENLNGEIQALKTDIERLLKEADNLIPRDLIDGVKS